MKPGFRIRSTQATLAVGLSYSISLRANALARKAIKIDIKQMVLHEAGYRCGNPACRTPLTLEVHHLDYVSEGGKDAADNLLPLCPNCHALHHSGHIPTESLKAWKLILLSLNEGFNKQAIDILLALDELSELSISGDGMLQVPGLLVSHLVTVRVRVTGAGRPSGVDSFKLILSDKGRRFIENWKAGNQEAAVVGGMKTIKQNRSARKKTHR